VLVEIGAVASKRKRYTKFVDDRKNVESALPSSTHQFAQGENMITLDISARGPTGRAISMLTL
jgi:hypothetical protein